MSWKGLLGHCIQSPTKYSLHHGLPESSFPAWPEQFQRLSLCGYALNVIEIVTKNSKQIYFPHILRSPKQAIGNPGLIIQ